MLRAPSLVAAIALCSLLIGGAVWLRASLASAFARGEAHGRALAAVEAGAALAEQGARLESVRRDADRQAAALESEKDALREKLDDIEKLLASPARGAAGHASGGASRGDAPCLDAGLVRALDALRAPGRGAGAP